VNDDDRSGWIGLLIILALYLVIVATVWLVIQRIDQLAAQ